MEQSYKTLPNTKGKILVLPMCLPAFIRACGCDKVRRDLWRCTEEYWSCWCGDCDYPRGSNYRGCASGYSLPCCAIKHMQTMASMYNTPPAYGIYICGKVFQWLKRMGGLESMKERNEKKGKDSL